MRREPYSGEPKVSTWEGGTQPCGGVSREPGGVCWEDEAGSFGARSLKVWGLSAAPPRVLGEPKSSRHPDKGKPQTEVSFNPTSPPQSVSPPPPGLSKIY